MTWPSSASVTHFYLKSRFKVTGIYSILICCRKKTVLLNGFRAKIRIECAGGVSNTAFHNIIRRGHRCFSTAPFFSICHRISPSLYSSVCPLTVRSCVRLLAAKPHMQLAAASKNIWRNMHLTRSKQAYLCYDADIDDNIILQTILRKAECHLLKHVLSIGYVWATV